MLLYISHHPAFRQLREVSFVTMQFPAALAALREPGDISSPAYREACEVVAANRNQLSYRVFINLPGGLSGNADPSWDAVKASSTALCGCGNERSIEPLSMRQVFEPSTAEPIIMQVGDEVYVRPVGAPASAAYAKFELVEGDGELAWTFMPDPMSSVLNFSELFSGPKGYKLASLVEPLAQQDEPAVFMQSVGDLRVPVVGVSAVDLEARTLTMLLDAGVEVFDPDEERTHVH